MNGFSSFLKRWNPLIEYYNMGYFNIYHMARCVCVLENFNCMCLMVGPWFLAFSAFGAIGTRTAVPTGRVSRVILVARVFTEMACVFIGSLFQIEKHRRFFSTLALTVYRSYRFFKSRKILLCLAKHHRQQFVCSDHSEISLFYSIALCLLTIRNSRHSWNHYLAKRKEKSV